MHQVTVTSCTLLTRQNVSMLKSGNGMQVVKLMLIVEIMVRISTFLDGRSSYNISNSIALLTS